MMDPRPSDTAEPTVGIGEAESSARTLSAAWFLMRQFNEGDRQSPENNRNCKRSAPREAALNQLRPSLASPRFGHRNQ